MREMGTLDLTLLGVIVGFSVLISGYKLGSLSGQAKPDEKKKVEKNEEPEKDESSSSEEEEELDKGKGNGEKPSNGGCHKLKKLGKDKPDQKSKNVEKNGENKTKKVKDPDWEWPAYDEWYSRATHSCERKLRSKDDNQKSKGIPFEVVYQRKEDWPDVVSVTFLNSSHLVRIVKDCLPMNKQFLVSKPKVAGEALFLAMDKLRNYEVDPGNAVARLHLNHLLRFLEQEYKDTKVQVDRMHRDHTVSWEMLWAFLTPGKKVLYHCEISDEPLCAVVNDRWYEKGGQGKYLSVTLDVMDFNGQNYRRCMVERSISEFRNERPFTSLSVCPMEYVEQRERMESMLLANGKKFYKLSTQPNCFLHYEGSLHRVRFIPGTSCRQVIKKKADGRVMIDLWSFAKMNPGYPMNNARPPRTCDACSSGDEPEDEDLILAPAIVYGFSFGLKQWGCFQTRGLSKIFFDDQSFDRHLVMKDEMQKKMLLGLVTQYLRSPETATGTSIPQSDFISNKGEGCIFLCYGPPGTGKTLTAESIAEKLHRPLWSVSTSEFGETAGDLESKLLEIMDVASSWRAVLLIDEADIYLEKRTSGGDPSRITKTGIFLRLLEYYRGVLFLTTNRVMTFDDAFCSRISMFLRYRPLSTAERAKIWGNFLRLCGQTDVELQTFAEYELNGREIRNCIRTAQTWAMSCSEPLTTNHILSALAMMKGFREDLENALRDEGDLDELRLSSIFSKFQDQIRGSMLLHHESPDNGYANGKISSVYT